MKRRIGMWWTLEEEEGFSIDVERKIGDPTPTFDIIDEEEMEGTGILDAEGNEIPRAEKLLGFLRFGDD